MSKFQTKMETGNHSRHKRAFPDDDGSNKSPPQKRVRFPKSKKVKFAFVDEEAEPIGPKDAKQAATERMLRRIRVTPELLDEDNRGDLSRAEFHDYQDDETVIDDDVQLEPFNLSRERKEGYFDADGNYMEYVKENEIKDAWLDSITAQQQSSGQRPVAPRKEPQEEAEAPDLNSEEIARIKRRIADVLEPGETVLKALKRLKGSSNNRNVRMTAGTRQVFDQLTDDAVKLLNDGNLDVYNEKQETFQREAEGYERLARARGLIPAVIEGAEEIDVQNGDDEFDMFAEVDAATTNPPSASVGSHNVEDNVTAEGGNSETDYNYDETSGYYYSSSSGYYYDPSSGLYCSAATGLWYSYNEATGTYEEVQQAAPAVN